jgi:salicylate hydroxylase
MSSNRLQVGIVGAGIAGLAAAIAFRRANCDIEVFERSSFRNEIGAAVTISPNSARVLDHWGFDSAKARATENHQVRLKIGSTLDSVYEEVYGSLEGTYGHKNWSFHRVDLHDGLAKLATDPDLSEGHPTKIRLATEVTGVDCDKGELTMANGQTIGKDLVVIADGAHVRGHTYSSIP